MGLRFRTSFQLIPGLRLSLGSGGPRLNVGPRGLSLGIGRRSTRLNVGLPGTGISGSFTLLQHGEGGRAGYRAAEAARRAELARLEAQRQADAALAALSAQVQVLNVAVAELAHIAALTSVLADRCPSPVSLMRQLEPSPPPAPQPFAPTAFDPGPLRAQAARERPIWPWLALLALGAALSFGLLPWTSALVGLGLHAGTALIGVLAQRLRASGLVQQRAPAARRAHEAAEAERQHRHAAEQRAALEGHPRREATKAELRAALAEGRPGPLAALLEAELADEDFPVPIVVELELDGLRHASLALTLPELDDLPLHKPHLLPGRRVERRPIPPAERAALFDSLCSGVALRLIYEGFRVIPTLDSIELRGSFEAPAPGGARGRQVEAIGLHVRVSRARFAALDLDGLPPSALLRAIGRFHCDADGALHAIPDLPPALG